MPTTADRDDLFAEDAIFDPYTFFAQLREEDPVHWNDRHKLWVITRHDDVVWMVRNHECFSSSVIRNDKRPPYPPVDEADASLMDGIRAFRADQLVEQDRPQHLAMRHVVREYFTPGAMEKWRPFVRAAVAELLDSAVSDSCIDVTNRLAAPLPVTVIAKMMGVPDADRGLLREYADKLLYLNRGEPYRLRPLTEGIREITDYTETLVRQKGQCPVAHDDFVSVLIGGQEEGVFNHHQVLANAALLLFAGHETTMNLICNGLLALVRHPEQWQKLRETPKHLRLAVEECLRYEPPVKSTQRIATADVELRGKTIRRGDRLRWIIASANRDPDAFRDPDTFDITRHPNPHVAFGSGIHYCLGTSLARIEGQEILSAMAERFETMELESEALEYQPSIQFRSLRSLRIRCRIAS
jgi:cytochrome P450